MAIPKFEDFFSPILQYLKEKNAPISKKELSEFSISYFKPTQEELEDMLSNGSSRFIGNMGWAIVYLKKAELIEYVKRGIYQISDFGSEYLISTPQFRLGELKQIPVLQEWIEKSNVNTGRKNKNSEQLEDIEQENNSNVILATADYYESVEFDILDRLKNLGTHTVDKGTQFEDICLDLLETMGYGNKERTGGSGDRGIDGFLTTDKFGFERIGVQCKCYTDGKINDDQITKFAHGLKNVNGLNKGIFITTTDYTPSAKKVVEELKDIKIILINGVKLAQFMREYQIGVEVIETNFVYDIIIGEDN